MKTHTVLASPTASQAKKGPTSSSGTSGTAVGLPPTLAPSSGGTGSSSAGHNFARSIQSSLRSVSLGKVIYPKCYKNSNVSYTFVVAGQIWQKEMKIHSRNENFCNFAKVSYL